MNGMNSTSNQQDGTDRAKTWSGSVDTVRQVRYKHSSDEQDMSSESCDEERRPVGERPLNESEFTAWELRRNGLP